MWPRVYKYRGNKNPYLLSHYLSHQKSALNKEEIEKYKTYKIVLSVSDNMSHEQDADAL